MSSITLRNIPDHVLEQARAIAQRDRRSLNQALILLIEQGLEKAVARALISAEPLSAQAQSEIWKTVAGKWDDSRSAGELIQEIRLRRTKGRVVKL